MTGFFTIGDYIFDLVKPSDNQEEGCCAECFNFCCNCCLKVFDLVRSDAMTYINAAGTPYCNAARYCEYITDKSLLLEGSQSASRTYRICAHLLIAGAAGILGLYVKGTIGALSILFIVIAALFISTFFISIHADAAEAIIILFLNNEEVEMRHILKSEKGNRKDARHFDKMKWRREELKEEVSKVREAELEENKNEEGN